jgi:hypothetical protein
MFLLSVLLVLAAAVPSTRGASVCDELHGVPLITSDSGVAPFSSDWSAISFAEPACVAVPTSLEQVQHVIKFARLNGLFVTARGNGHSTGGHVLNGNNIVLDTTGFDSVQVDANGHFVDAGVGAFWFDVVGAAAQVGKRPAAIVDTVSETTVGGVVSLAGTSAVALTNGLVVDAVLAFDAVDGKGNVHRGVSASHDKTLFAAARGGLGQFAVITSVRIRLVDVVPVTAPDGATDATGGQLPPAVIAHTFVFDNDALFAAYVHTLATTATAASVDGADIISLKNDESLFLAVFGAAGSTIYNVVTSNLSPTAKYYHIVNVVDLAPLNPALAAPPSGSLPLGTTAFSWLTFALRNVEQFGRAHESLAWYAPKASRVVFVPHDAKTADLITKVLAKLSGSDEFYSDILPACQLSLKLLDTSLISATSLVRVPRLTREAIEIGVICLDDAASTETQTGQTNLAQRQRRLQSEIDALIRAEAHSKWGAENVKAYAWNSQWECWHDHFGRSAWPLVVALKQEYDPCAILGRGVGIFPQQRTRACSSGIDQPFECSFGSESSSDASSSDTIDSGDSKHLELLQNALNVDVSDFKH